MAIAHLQHRRAGGLALAVFMKSVAPPAIAMAEVYRAVTPSGAPRTLEEAVGATTLAGPLPR